MDQSQIMEIGAKAMWVTLQISLPAVWTGARERGIVGERAGERRVARLARRDAEVAGKLHLAVSHLAEPRRAVDCFSILFGRAIGDGVYGLATGEAMAHLRHLEAGGRAQREVRDGVAHLTDFAALLTNPALWMALGHVVSAALLTGGLLMAGLFWRAVRSLFVGRRPCWGQGRARLG